jgi:hypothetical protein
MQQGLPLPVSIYNYTWNAGTSAFVTSITGRTKESRARWLSVSSGNHRFNAIDKGVYLVIVQAATGATVPLRKNIKIEVASPSVAPAIVEAKNVPFTQPKYTGTTTPETYMSGGLGPFYRYVHDLLSESIDRVWSPYGHISGQWVVQMNAGDLFSFQVKDSFLDAMVDCMAIVFRLHPMSVEEVEDANLLRLAISGNPSVVGGITINRLSSPNNNRRRWRIVSTSGGKVVWALSSTEYKSAFAHELRVKTYARSGPSTCRVRAYNGGTVLSSQNLTISDPADTEYVQSYVAGNPTITSLEVDNIPAGVTFDLEARLNVVS